MPLTLDGINSTPRSDTLNSLQLKSFPVVAAIGAAAVNTTVQNYPIIFPFNYKIRKVSILFTAIDSIAGTDSFNIVLGTGAYVQNNPVPNDNSFDPTVGTTVGVNIAQPVVPVLGGLGYPTNVGVAGQSVFTTDVLLNAINVPNIATGTGGYATLIPQNYDAVYPLGIPLTIRATTTAGTGSITNFQIALAITPVRLRPAPVGSQVYGAVPGIDY